VVVLARFEPSQDVAHLPVSLPVHEVVALHGVGLVRRVAQDLDVTLVVIRRAAIRRRLCTQSKEYYKA
jgi:hypothetical protein